MEQRHVCLEGLDYIKRNFPLAAGSFITQINYNFGTVALGKDNLLDKIDAHLPELRSAFEELKATVPLKMNI